MFDERIFYFIHGFATMFFLASGFSLLRKEEGGGSVSRIKRILSCVLLLWCLLEVKDLFYYGEAVFRYNYISNLLILIDLLAIPAGSCLIFELLHNGWVTWRRVAIGSLPYVVAFTVYGITRIEPIIPIMFGFTAIYAVILFFYLLWAVRRHNRLLRDNYSYTERINLHWLAGVALLLAICLIVWVLSCYYSSWIVDSIYQLFLIVMWSVITHYASKQQPVSETLLDTEKEEKMTDDKEAFNFRHELDRLMSEEKIWLKPHLTLAELAILAGTNRTYLSTYLNNTLQTTFYDYINSQRIEAAIRMIEDPACTATMAEVSESCGFNSISTFRRIFVARTGCSFATYRERCAQKAQ